MAYGFAERAVGGIGAALPARGLFDLAAESFLEEIEACVGEGFREPRCDSGECAKFDISLECSKALGGDEAIFGLEEIGLADVERLLLGRVDAGEVS